MKDKLNEPVKWCMNFWVWKYRKTLKVLFYHDFATFAFRNIPAFSFNFFYNMQLKPTIIHSFIYCFVSISRYCFSPDFIMCSFTLSISYRCSIQPKNYDPPMPVRVLMSRGCLQWHCPCCFVLLLRCIRELRRLHRVIWIRAGSCRQIEQSKARRARRLEMKKLSGGVGGKPIKGISQGHPSCKQRGYNLLMLIC